MWKAFVEVANLVLNLSRDLQQNRADIKELQSEMRELSAFTQKEVRQLREAIQRLAHELQRIQENEAHEREKMELRFEIQKLRAAQSLPAAEIEPPSNEATE